MNNIPVIRRRGTRRRRRRGPEQNWNAMMTEGEKMDEELENNAFRLNEIEHQQQQAIERQNCLAFDAHCSIAAGELLEYIISVLFFDKNGYILVLLEQLRKLETREISIDPMGGHERYTGAMTQSARRNRQLEIKKKKCEIIKFIKFIDGQLEDIVEQVKDFRRGDSYKGELAEKIRETDAMGVFVNYPLDVPAIYVKDDVRKNDIIH